MSARMGNADRSCCSGPLTPKTAPRPRSCGVTLWPRTKPLSRQAPRARRRLPHDDAALADAHATPPRRPYAPVGAESQTPLRCDDFAARWTISAASRLRRPSRDARGLDRDADLV